MSIRTALSRRWTKARVRGVVIALVVLSLLAGGLGVVFVACKRDDDKQAFQLRVSVPSTGAPFGAALYQSLGVRLLPGHHVRLLSNGSIFDGLEEEIRRARSSVHVVLYIWEKGVASDRIVAALVERAKAGIGCRILVDDLGSPDFGKDVQPTLVAAGCEVRIFRPLPGKGDKLARNHRKIVVVDGQVAFTGGFGMRDSWLGDGITAEGWRDANVRFTGPSVADAQQAFAENWQEAGGALLPPEAFPTADTSGPASAAFVASTISPVLTRSERLLQLMIQAAKKRLWIANAYFVPSKAILEMRKRKAAEGVDVRLLAPGKKSDSKTSFGVQHIEYDSLLEKGVRVWEYQPSMMHAKTMLVDDELSSVASINLDPLSLSKLEEVALVVQIECLPLGSPKRSRRTAPTPGRYPDEVVTAATGLARQACAVDDEECGEVRLFVRPGPRTDKRDVVGRTRRDAQRWCSAPNHPAQGSRRGQSAMRNEVHHCENGDRNA